MKKSLIVIGVLSIVACGGGSGSSGNVSAGAEINSVNSPNASSVSSSSLSAVPKVYSLQKLNSTKLGTIYTTQITGIDSDGVKYTGSVSLENRAEKVVSGVMVTPREHFLSYKSIGGLLSETSTGTAYIETATGNLISEQSNGVTCTSVSPYHMPAFVKVGDFGITSTLTCSNQDTKEGSWRAEDAGNGNIRMVFNDTIKNFSGEIFSIEEDSYTLDPTGSIAELKVSANFVLVNYTIVLSDNTDIISEPIADAINEPVKVSGVGVTATINSTKRTDLIVSGTENTVNVKSNIGILKVSGVGNILNFSSGVTVESCSVSGTNNKAIKNNNVILSCTVSGTGHVGF